MRRLVSKFVLKRNCRSADYLAQATIKIIPKIERGQARLHGMSVGYIKYKDPQATWDGRIKRSFASATLPRLRPDVP